MALVSTLGSSAWVPDHAPIVLGPPAFTSIVIDATGEKYAFIGRVWFPAKTGTKNISRVGFRFGTVTKAGGSALTVSLQDVATGAGPPTQPDETQDQTVAIANADGSFVSNTWIRTGTFNTTRTVTFGELLAVVVEFDGGGRLGSDAVQFSLMQAANSTAVGHQSPALKTGGTWAASNTVNNLILEFDDGSFGIFDGGYAFSALNFISFASNTAGSDEYALEFQVPAPCACDGIYAVVYGSGTSDFELLLYSGTTALATVTIDGNTLAGASDYRPVYAPIAEQTLSPGTTYRIAVRPTTTNAVRVYYGDVSDANHWAAMDGGTGMVLTSRLDQGSWAAATTTRRIFAGVRISKIDDGTGSGGVGPRIHQVSGRSIFGG